MTRPTPLTQPPTNTPDSHRQWLGWSLLLSLLLLGGGSIWWMREQSLVAQRDQRQEQTLRQARRSAQQGDLLAALRLIESLTPDSPAGQASQALRQQWTEQLIEQARQEYTQGRLEPALQRLAKLPRSREIEAIAATWRRDWANDTALLARIRQEIAQARWWEVERTATRVSTNPYWQRQARQLVAQARAVIEKLAAAPVDHPRTGSERTIADAQLEPLFNRYRAQGQDEYTAWNRACRDAGGRAVDAGPETLCERE